VILDAVARNETSVEFRRLMAKYGGDTDNIVIIDQAAVKGDFLLDIGGAAQRLGGSTFIIDGKVLGAFGRQTAWDGVLRHEFAHSIWDSLSNTLKQGFRERLAAIPRTSLAGRADRLDFTDYPEAWARENEAFSEAIRVVTDPQFNPGAHSPEFREMAKWLKTNL